MFKPAAWFASAAVTALAAVAHASPVTVYLGGASTTFNGNPVTVTPFDDTFIEIGIGDGNLHGNEDRMRLRRTSTGLVNNSLIAAKDMFNLLPKNDVAGTIQILDAKLHLYSAQAVGAGFVVEVYRVTTDWLPDAAGTNENDVSGLYAEHSSSTSWAAGGFSSADYDTGASSSVIWNGAYGGLHSLDVTALVAAMYSAEANYGFLLRTTTENNGVILSIRSSEFSIPAGGIPILEITYDRVPEPASLGLLLSGGLLILTRLGRRNGGKN